MSSEKDQLSERVGQAVASAADATALWRELGRLGVLTEMWSSGRGDKVEIDALEAMLEKLDATTDSGMVLSVCVQTALAIPLLKAGSHDNAFVRDVYDRARTGRVVVAVAATDCDISGSALMELRTEVLHSGGRMVLRGCKAWISNATHSDFVLVLARRTPGWEITNFCWILLPVVTSRLIVEKIESPCFSGAGLGNFKFHDVEISETNILSQPARSMAELGRQLASERLAGALWLLMICNRAMRECLRHLRSRSIGRDGTLWDNDAIRERFANCLVDLLGLRAMCHTYRGAADCRAAIMALKTALGDRADRILSECVALTGTHAFDESGLALLREEVAMLRVAGGAPGAMLAVIADRADDLLYGA